MTAANNTQVTTPSIHGVAQIILVASGKGGVGKSSTAVNLALALKNEGKTIGLLDADIYGPSIPNMLGVKAGTRPETKEGKYFLPVAAHGIQFMSMGLLATADTPMVWRGPMASGALVQMLTQTQWQNVDILVVDMPPGTGDIQLSISQKAPVSGVVIVTTPQDIALLDAIKAVEMFNKVSIDVLGLIENMATHTCSACGFEEHIFGEGGGDFMADKYQVEQLGALPLDIRIRQDMDAGNPSVVRENRADIADAYKKVAQKTLKQLAIAISKQKTPEISVE